MTDALVITIDGNDIFGCHANIEEQLGRVDVSFIREADMDPFGYPIAPVNEWPEQWIKSAGVLKDIVERMEAPSCAGF